MADGLSWFGGGPREMIQKLSHAEGEIDDNVGRIIGESVDLAKKNMQDSIMDGGNTKKGGPRIESGKMYNSVDGEVTKARGRITGAFGYLNDPPEWTIYQERGTQFVSPLLAFAKAQEIAINDLTNKMEQGAWAPASLL
jgi:hypothetical protein